ncbi:MAG: hypothetical protein HUJ22_05715 [Gracilimonas sp.]|nr:hypothetical protein [Gracilimonas sp.]
MIFLLVSVSLMSCSRNDDQVKFEKEAYSAPAGYTETNFQGEVQSEDPDDWRISPLYQGTVRVNPPFPNPVTTDQPVNFEIEVISVQQSINGLFVVTRNNDGTLKSPPLYERFETLDQGLTTFTINPIEFGFQGSPEGARGLHRVFIFDGNQQMISYGDIMVE